MATRRQFIQSTFALGAGIALAGRWSRAFAFSQTPTIPLFATNLRGVGPGGIPVAASDGISMWGATHYTMDIQQFQDQVLPDSFGFATTLWGYHPATPLGGAQAQRHLGGLLVAQKGQAIQVTFNNKLPWNPALASNLGMHILPNDTTLPGANLGNFRTATHFHGGLVPWISDGGPHSWFDPNGGYGASVMSTAGNIYSVVNPALAPGQAEVYYPMNQSARFGWYHDHALGITRINAYAGIASGILIRDAAEADLVKTAGLPPYVETSVLAGNPPQELPLVFQDKVFVGPSIDVVDPTWKNVVAPIAREPGSLWYAHVYERDRWALKATANPLPDPSCIPEFFGDTMLVNGTAFPTVNVEPRRYRLRLLNACNARFLNLQLYLADGSPNGITLNAAGNPTNAPFVNDLYGTGGSPAVLQIGTEGGFLPRPALVPSNVPFNPATFTGSLIVAPAERPDLIVDFSAARGRAVILYNDAPAPFPGGDPRNDYFPGFNVKGNPVNGTTPAGFGPNTRVLMRFVVGTSVTTPKDKKLGITTATAMPGLDVPVIPFGQSVVPAGVPVRSLTLNETSDAYGRLIQMLGTTTPVSSSGGFGRTYDAPATENVANNATEVWEIFNTTADVHPMHFHLVNAQVINRQPFQVSSLGNTNGGVNYTGPAVAADANETGFKETVKMFPGTATRIVMKVALPATPFAVPASPRTGGNEYVWHCHILEHEEHDMMRPLIVT